LSTRLHAFEPGGLQPSADARTSISYVTSASVSISSSSSEKTRSSSSSRYPPAVAFGNCARSATVPVRSPNDARRPLHVATTPPLVASAVGSKNADWSRGASVASAATVARVRVAVLVA